MVWSVLCTVISMYRTRTEFRVLVNTINAGLKEFTAWIAVELR